MKGFIAVFAASLFLPRHILGLEELYWSAASAYFLSVSGLSGRRPDMRLVRAWIVVIGVWALSYLFSASPAGSVFSGVRMLIGFAAFIIASRNEEDAGSLEPMLVLTAKAAILVLLGSISIQYLRDALPQYNSIVSVHGHHPLAYLLVFLLPFGTPGTGIRRLVRSIFLAGGIVLSNARGVWIVTAIYLCITAFRLKTNRAKLTVLAASCAVLTVVSGMLWLSLLPYDQKMTLLGSTPALSYIMKESDDGLRGAYIRHALEALRSSPAVGYGPGTFELASRRFQSEPQTYSAYAHSWPAETIAETGLLGILAFAVLAFTAVQALDPVFRTRDARLAWGLLLTLLYSTFEGNLNPLPYWVLFWFVLGTLTGQRKYGSPVLQKRVTGLLVGAFLLYTASFLTSAAAGAAKNMNAAIWLAPYRKDAVVSYLRAPDAKEVPPVFLSYWYRKDPDIWFLAASTGDSGYQRQYTEHALTLDPLNTEFIRSYLHVLQRQHEYGRLSNTLCMLAGRFSPADVTGLCTLMNTQAFREFVSRESSFVAAINHVNGKDGPAKLFYFLGLSYYEITSDANGLVLFWRTARDMAPEWGYYHLELASAQYSLLRNPEEAQATIASCRLIRSARQGCVTIGRTLDTLYPVGMLRYDIAAIPGVLSP